MKDKNSSSSSGSGETPNTTTTTTTSTAATSPSTTKPKATSTNGGGLTTALARISHARVELTGLESAISARTRMLSEAYHIAALLQRCANTCVRVQTKVRGLEALRLRAETSVSEVNTSTRSLVRQHTYMTRDLSDVHESTSDVLARMRECELEVQDAPLRAVVVKDGKLLDDCHARLVPLVPECRAACNRADLHCSLAARTRDVESGLQELMNAIEDLENKMIPNDDVVRARALSLRVGELTSTMNILGVQIERLRERADTVGTDLEPSHLSAVGGVEAYAARVREALETRAHAVAFITTALELESDMHVMDARLRERVDSVLGVSDPDVGSHADMTRFISDCNGLERLASGQIQRVQTRVHSLGLVMVSELTKEDEKEGGNQQQAVEVEEEEEEVEEEHGGGGGSNSGTYVRDREKGGEEAREEEEEEETWL